MPYPCRACSSVSLVGLAVALVACGSPPSGRGPDGAGDPGPPATVAIAQPAVPSQGEPGTEADPSPDAETAAASSPDRTNDALAPKPAPAGPGLSASVAMTQEGTVDPPRLVAEVNRQRGRLQSCGPLVRKTDPVVGSLNLSLEVLSTGRVKPDLQSPVNPEALRCLLDAAGAWVIRGAGTGRAMLLLVLDDAAGP